MTTPVTAPGATPVTTPADLTITVHGHRPAPQGSKRSIGRGRMIEQSNRVKPWRDAVETAARAAHAARPPLDGPLIVEATFTVAKPASAPKRRATWPTTRHSGDLDKLLRSTFDALTDAGAIADDSRVIKITASKVHPSEGPLALADPGAVIRIWRLHTEEAAR